MSQLATKNQAELMESVLIGGNLEQLTPEQRVMYYKQVCESVGLNPLTKPFEYIKLNGKLTLYAKRDATDQLRKIHGVSIVRLERDNMQGVYVVTAYARDKDGREDSSTGAVPIENVKGDALANALMKAETKAKRRVTLSICGLGMLDETELDTIPSARPEATPEPVETFQVVSEVISAAQIKALSILLKEAGFKTDEQGKQQSRDFVSYLLDSEGIEIIKDLTRNDARIILDYLGTGENGSYRADKKKVETAVEEWTKRLADKAANDLPWNDQPITDGIGIDELLEAK